TVLSLRRGFCLGNDVAAYCVQRRRRKAVLVATPAQFTGDDRADTLADRHQACRLFVQLVGRVRKLSGELASVAAVEGVNKAGSFEREVEHGLECVIENGIAGMVGEIRDQDTNGFVSGFLCRTGKKLLWQ